jgi:hypothetical protein
LIRLYRLYRLIGGDRSMDPIVKPLTCPSCGKSTNVRVMPTATEHRYHCPHCKAIQTAKG